jgi:ATP-dependent RNA helicase RhlE
MPLLRDIERLLGAPIPSETVAGFEPDRSVRAEPIRLRTGGGFAGQRGRGTTHRSRHSVAGQQPRRQRPPRAKGGASIGNRNAGHDHWTSLPGERKRR